MFETNSIENFLWYKSKISIKPILCNCRDMINEDFSICKFSEIKHFFVESDFIESRNVPNA